MLRLMLLRHAKADRPVDPVDHERPLSLSGHTQARTMGEYIHTKHLTPDTVIVSSAKRAQETWAEARDAGKLTSAALTESQLYNASLDDLLDVIRQQDSTQRSIMLVGHNPGMERLTAHFIKDGNDAAMTHWQQGFVVGALAVIELPASAWSTVQAQSGRLEHFETPETADKRKPT